MRLKEMLPGALKTIAIWSIAFGVQAATVGFGADCRIQSYISGVGSSLSCASSPGITAEQISFPDGSAQATYIVNVTEYGHLGGLVQTFVQHANTNNGLDYVSADSQLSLYYVDAFTVTSATLPTGTAVPFNVDYRVDGNTGVNFGNPAPGSILYGTQLSVTGRFEIGYQNGGAPALDSTFCLREYATSGCAKILPGVAAFEVLSSQTVNLIVGVSYTIMSNMVLQSNTGVNTSIRCTSDFCDAGSYADVSNSFFSYITPTGGGYQLTTESGHNYALPIPEPSTSVLIGLGLLVCIPVIRQRLS